LKIRYLGKCDWFSITQVVFRNQPDYAGIGSRLQFCMFRVMPRREENLRVCGEAPFCWQHKPALRKIREAFDAEKTVTTALAVYLALTEIASDEESEKFQTTHSWISQKSGVSPRTVQTRLNQLKEIRVIDIFTPALKSPSIYRLIAVLQPLPRARQRAKSDPLPSSEECIEEINEKSYPTKSGKLTAQQKELADRIEAALGNQWINDAGKWINRIKGHFEKCERVISEVQNALREGRVKTTPAQYSENIWQEFVGL
jgi:DNA-binding Lrp family transcriptional regulator